MHIAYLFRTEFVQPFQMPPTTVFKSILPASPNQLCVLYPVNHCESLTVTAQLSFCKVVLNSTKGANQTKDREREMGKEDTFSGRRQ